MESRIEKILWSIALPGFGQLLNGKYMKGILFIGLELLVNVQSNFNEVIISSFHGDVSRAISHANYKWLMFYPCLYFFAAWDTYRDVEGGKLPYSYFPFIFSAYFVTLGLIYSPNFRFFGFLLGPVWLPILCCFLGVGLGLSFKWLLLKRHHEKEHT